MLGSVLHESGIPASHSSLQLAARYIASKQGTIAGDWARRNQGTPPGGWGFSDINTRYPDVDDSTAALSFLQRIAPVAGRISAGCRRPGSALDLVHAK